MTPFFKMFLIQITKELGCKGKKEHLNINLHSCISDITVINISSLDLTHRQS